MTLQKAVTSVFNILHNKIGSAHQVLQLHTQSQLFEEKYWCDYWSHPRTPFLLERTNDMPFKFQDKSMEFNRVGFQMSHGS